MRCCSGWRSCARPGLVGEEHGPLVLAKARKPKQPSFVDLPGDRRADSRSAPRQPGISVIAVEARGQPAARPRRHRARGRSARRHRDRAAPWLSRSDCSSLAGEPSGDRIGADLVKRLRVEHRVDADRRRRRRTRGRGAEVALSDERPVGDGADRCAEAPAAAALAGPADRAGDPRASAGRRRADRLAGVQPDGGRAAAQGRLCRQDPALCRAQRLGLEAGAGAGAEAALRRSAGGAAVRAGGDAQARRAARRSYVGHPALEQTGFRASRSRSAARAAAARQPRRANCGGICR